MHAIQWIELIAGAILVAFIVFAYRQGMKVKSPDDGGGSGDHGHSPDTYS